MMDNQGYDMSIHKNPDAKAWTSFFMETCRENGWPCPEEDIMLGWFANAMMAMHDHLTGDGPVELPDGSAVVTGLVG